MHTTNSMSRTFFDLHDASIMHTFADLKHEGKMRSDVKKLFHKFEGVIEEFDKFSARLKDVDGASEDDTKEISAVIDEIGGLCRDASVGLDELHGELRADDGVETGDVDALHEAICEGRKQDAIDILNRIFPEANLRTVAAQSNLFPDRVIS